MTFRAIILAMAGAAFIAAVGHLNDQVARLNHFVGNHFPIIVFGPLILVAMFANPVLRRLGRGWRFRPAELAVAVTLTLVACNIPGSGLLRFFPRTLLMPMHVNQTDAGWRKNQVLRYVPASMMPGDGDYDEEVMEGVLYGRGRPGEPIGIARIPWPKWWPALATWMPLVILVAVASICMSLIVHRQWSRHERLRYPIADFAATIMGQQPGGGTIFGNKLFWAGVLAIFGIHVINGLHVWFPERCIEIPLAYDFRPILSKFRSLQRALWSWSLAYPRLYPTAVAFAFFLARDVSFSIGISQVIWVPLAAWCVVAGLPMREDFMGGGLPAWQRFGSYAGLAGAIVYVGRRHYWGVLRSALGARRAEGIEPYMAWAGRIGLLATAALIGLFISLGLDWHFAVLMVAMMLMSYVVMARMNAESGLVLSQAYWQPAAVLMGLFGFAALGPKALVIVGMLCVMFTIDRRECLMPFLINGLKLCEAQRVRPARLGRWGLWIFLVALSAGVPVAMWSDYNFGIACGEGWSTFSAPKYTFNTASREITHLKLSGELGESQAYSSWERLTHMRPDPKFLWAAGVGLAAVIVFSVLRLRHTWWPLHPILFLGWGSWAFACFSHSFLLGWFLKVLLTKLGGERMYTRAKALMIGVIAGDLLGGMLWMGVGAIYYGATGLAPKRYHIFPGG